MLNGHKQSTYGLTCPAAYRYGEGVVGELGRPRPSTPTSFNEGRGIDGASDVLWDDVAGDGRPQVVMWRSTALAVVAAGLGACFVRRCWAVT